MAQSCFFRHRRHAAIQEDGNGFKRADMNYDDKARTEINRRTALHGVSTVCAKKQGRSKARAWAVLYPRLSDFGPQCAIALPAWLRNDMQRANFQNVQDA
jgi:hypothetical protein